MIRRVLFVYNFENPWKNEKVKFSPYVFVFFFGERGGCYHFFNSFFFCLIPEFSQFWVLTNQLSNHNSSRSPFPKNHLALTSDRPKKFVIREQNKSNSYFPFEIILKRPFAIRSVKNTYRLVFHYHKTPLTSRSLIPIQIQKIR